jgi:hypothetical protein
MDTVREAPSPEVRRTDIMPDPLIDLLDSGSLRVGAYGVVAVLAVWWGIRERRGVAALGVDWWPTYWFLSASVLVMMGVARAGAVGDLVGDIGREQARSSGWYDARRTFQAIGVVAVAVVWAIGVIVAIWRVPPRRRRYLPHVVAFSTVIAFAAVRIVSLHHLDAVLYRRDIGGVRIVAILELSLLASTVVAAFVTSRFPGRHSPEPTISAPA